MTGDRQDPGHVHSQPNVLNKGNVNLSALSRSGHSEALDEETFVDVPGFPTPQLFVPRFPATDVAAPSGATPRLGEERDGPAVSVIIACRNSAAFLPDCLTSVCRQTLGDIEIIVVDDASDDESRGVVESFMSTDTRITLLCCETRGGPARARNRALDVCRGRWVAVVDSDDLLHRERLALLVQAAEEGDLDIVADNQILFDDASGRDARPLLRGDLAREPADVVCADYVRSNSLQGRMIPLGYLKPLFRRALIEGATVRYNPDLPIAEDYDFVFRLLLAGASFKTIPYLTYFYRRHSASTSFRLSRDALVRMLKGDAVSCQGRGPIPPDVQAALQERRRSIETVLAFTDLVTRLKSADMRGAVSAIASRPAAALLLSGVVRDRVRRWLSRPAFQAKPGRSACVLSRQRVTGATNGSSAYLLGICESLRDDGWAVDLVCPSPAMFGRWPIFKLQPEMSVFRSISIRGAVRLGSFVVATNPAIALRALLALADRFLGRLNLGLGAIARKAPHAIAVPFTDADRLFVASRTGRPSLIVADYAFLTDAIPFAMSPRAPSAVVMHDLFSAQKTENRPVVIDRDREMALLGAADIVLAIQREEADVVAAHQGADRVIVVPMAVKQVDSAQPGDGRTVMFVGSNTLPNADAVDWLLKGIWPKVVEACPRARLVVAGSVCQAVRSQRSEVQFLGRVDALAEIYRGAAVVVSPLRSGSGLKVKLVEALAHGKAMVGTSTTFQGVEHLAGMAALCTDDADVFARFIVGLLEDESERRAQGERALIAATREFSPVTSRQEFLRFASGRREPSAGSRVQSSITPLCSSYVETVRS